MNKDPNKGMTLKIIKSISTDDWVHYREAEGNEYCCQPLADSKGIGVLSEKGLFIIYGDDFGTEYTEIKYCPNCGKKIEIKIEEKDLR